jgi:hypothetical protein
MSIADLEKSRVMTRKTKGDHKSEKEELRLGYSCTFIHFASYELARVLKVRKSTGTSAFPIYRQGEKERRRRPPPTPRTIQLTSQRISWHRSMREPSNAGH